MNNQYQLADYKNPLFTVDSVLFTVSEGALKVLIVKRAIEPFIGQWGLPGGFVDVDVDLSTDITALRKLKEKTGVAPPYLEQLQVFSGNERDPRGFSVTLAYFALIAEQDAAPHIDTVDDVQWIDVDALANMSIAFDHQHIIEKAQQRLQQKALYSMLPVYCLPKYFTVAQLMQVIEIIIGKAIQRKSLLRRIDASAMFEKVDEKVKSGGRFAQLYTLKPGVSIVNFDCNLSI